MIARKLKEEMKEDFILEDYHVDAFFAKLIKKPDSFDTIVCESKKKKKNQIETEIVFILLFLDMFGDIISDLACEVAN